MKNTYNLLGLDWDHKKVPSEINFLDIAEEFQDYAVERNLFDLQEYTRSVKITELLKNGQDEIRSISGKLIDCDEVCILLDYEPKEKLEVIWEFYALRVLQIYEIIKNYLPDIKVVIIGSDNMRLACEKIIRVYAGIRK